jgi:tRNA threonylcarbamoyladenosine modification (KEOPS) complex  Pcc1 subunit
MGDDQGPDSAEATFADVFNGLSMGGGRARRRSGRARGQPEPAPRQQAAPQPLADAPAEEEPAEETAASVRAYAWTGGRTRSSVQLEIETLISTTPRAEDLLATMRSEHQSVTRLCRQAKSVAEIGALLGLPIGVVRVLLDDMAGIGLVTVHATQTTDGQPDVDLLQRVLRGLSNLRT